jgi:hypothetical protein
MLSVDEHINKLPVPELIYTSFNERKRSVNAKKRKDDRLALKQKMLSYLPADARKKLEKEKKVVQLPIKPSFFAKVEAGK